jgi:hypothetical protein
LADDGHAHLFQHFHAGAEGWMRWQVDARNKDRHKPCAALFLLKCTLLLPEDREVVDTGPSTGLEVDKVKVDAASALQADEQLAAALHTNVPRLRPHVSTADARVGAAVHTLCA